MAAHWDNGHLARCGRAGVVSWGRDIRLTTCDVRERHHDFSTCDRRMSHCRKSVASVARRKSHVQNRHSLTDAPIAGRGATCCDRMGARTSLGFGILFFRSLWEHNARTVLGKVKGIQDGSKGFEVLRPGVVPGGLPDHVGSVQELKVPNNSI